MRDKLKKLALVFMALCLLVTAAAPAQVKAAEKVALSAKKLTLIAGDTAELTLNNVPWDDRKSVTWSSSNEAVATVVEAWRQYYSAVCKIHVKKRGTAKITATYKNKKYTCTVKVKKFALSNTEGKNEKDVKALKAIIKKQNLKGATLPIDLDYCEDWYDGGYHWDEEGNLMGLDWSNCGLQGSLSLKEFESLEVFCCDTNDQLTSLDVSRNTALFQLVCSRCSLSKLDVSKNTALTLLSCWGNQLGSLDVSRNTALTTLDCGRNQLSGLDVSKNTALTVLRCQNNQLSSLDVSENTALTTLDCGWNELSSLDVSKNTALTELACYGNELSSLDVSKNTALTELYCYANQLSSLDVSRNTALTELDCSWNQLSSLDVSKHTGLTWLECSDNQLSKLDVSKCTALTELYCLGNQLSSLDLSKNKALTLLFCNDSVKVTGYSGDRAGGW